MESQGSAKLRGPLYMRGVLVGNKGDIFPVRSFGKVQMLEIPGQPTPVPVADYEIEMVDKGVSR